MRISRHKKEAGIWAVAALLLVASISLSLGVFVFDATNKIYTATEQVSRNWLPSVQAITKIRGSLTQLRREGGHMVIYGEECTARRCEDVLAERKQELAAAEAGYEPLVTPGDEQRLFDTYRQQREIYLQIQDQLIGRDKATRQSTLEEFITRSDDTYDRLLATLARLSEFNGEGGRKSQTVVDLHYERVRLSLYALNFLLLALAAALTVRLVSAASRSRN